MKQGLSTWTGEFILQLNIHWVVLQYKIIVYGIMNCFKGTPYAPTHSANVNAALKKDNPPDKKIPMNIPPSVECTKTKKFT